MLSSQTKDAVTSAAVTSLHTSLPGGLTAASLATAPLETIQECINKVGFWRRKAEYIQEAAKALLEQEGDEKGDVPKTVEGLCKLKGVGPKMAFLALQCAWDMCVLFIYPSSVWLNYLLCKATLESELMSTSTASQIVSNGTAHLHPPQNKPDSIFNHGFPPIYINLLTP